MKKLTITDLRSQLTAFDNAKSPLPFLRAVIKNSEDEYINSSAYRNADIKRLTPLFSLDDIENMKQITAYLETPKSFNSAGNYLMPLMRNRSKLQELLDKFNIDANNSERIIGNILQLTEGKKNGMY